MKILLATTSLGKLKEMKELFSHYFPNIDLLTLNDLKKVEEPLEDADTFMGNALIKAKYYYNIFKMPVISDDTGLCVDYLNGEPGIYTARYGSLHGEHTDPVKNYTRILNELRGVNNRKAYFKTAMIFYNGNLLVTSIGEMHGEIALEPRGINGFGYDPVFFIKEYNKTVAELPSEIKNKISHRGHAALNLVAQLKTIDIFRGELNEN